MYEHIEEFDDTRVHSDFSVMGEKLINFVFTIITSRLMNLFLDKGLLEKQTFGEVSVPSMGRIQRVKVSYGPDRRNR